MNPRHIPVLILFLCFAQVSAAQGINIGIRGGATMYKIDGKSFNDAFQWGYHAGFAAELMWSKAWGIQPEFLFNQSNTRTGYSFDTLYQSIDPGTLKDIKLNYLSIPIFLNWRPSPFITFQAGPQFSVLMSKQRTLLQDGAEAFRNGNVALLGGVQLNIFPIRIYGRYGMGLLNLNQIDGQDEWKSRSIQVGVGLMF